MNTKAVITVIGHDAVGILARVSAVCAAHSVNILDVSQSVLRQMFVMVMMVDTEKMDISFTAFADELSAAGTEMGLSVQTVHEDVYNAMHRI